MCTTVLVLCDVDMVVRRRLDKDDRGGRELEAVVNDVICRVGSSGSEKERPLFLPAPDDEHSRLIHLNLHFWQLSTPCTPSH